MTKLFVIDNIQHLLLLLGIKGHITLNLFTFLDFKNMAVMVKNLLLRKGFAIDGLCKVSPNLNYMIIEKNVVTYKRE
jgi:hypothetical protein